MHGHNVITALSVAILLGPKLVAAQTCYWPSGDVHNGATPCRSGGVVTHCCESTMTCLSNGLCLDTIQHHIVRTSCTDRTWESSLCPKYCRDGDMGKWYGDLRQCNGRNDLWVCGMDVSKCSSATTFEVPERGRVYDERSFASNAVVRVAQYTGDNVQGSCTATETRTIAPSSCPTLVATSRGTEGATPTPGTRSDGGDDSSSSSNDRSSSGNNTSSNGGSSNSSNAASNSTNLPAAAAESKESTTPLLVGVGVGVGVPLLAGLAAFLFLWLRARADAASARAELQVLKSEALQTQQQHLNMMQLAAAQQIQAAKSTSPSTTTGVMNPFEVDSMREPQEVHGDAWHYSPR